MDMSKSLELIRRYGVCPKCGNDKVGGEPSQGALIIEDEIFTRRCKCGWEVVVDLSIQHVTTLSKRRGGKLVGGCYEVKIHGHGRGRKLLPLLELKERAGVKRIDQHTKIEAWLNSAEGRKWALEVEEESVY